MLEYRKHITREEVRKERHKLFVFGDNLQRRGYGGQAKAMRNEPNAVGIITKYAPTWSIEAYLSDDCMNDWKLMTFKDINRLMLYHQNGGTIVWPTAGIGTGFAELPQRAPKIYQLIKDLEMTLRSRP